MSFDAPVIEEAQADPGWPTEIRIDRRACTLELAWGGRTAVLSHRALRRSCRCSECESARRRIDGVLPVAADVVLQKLEPVGSVGLQLFFSDGHSRGIYPWAYLQQMAFGPASASGYTVSLMKGWRDE